MPILSSASARAWMLPVAQAGSAAVAAADGGIDIARIALGVFGDDVGQVGGLMLGL